MGKLRIVNAQVLAGRNLVDAEIVLDGEFIEAIGAGGRGSEWDVAGALVLPGIVDLHGDAFERQVMPRPGVFFAEEIALADTDRQLAANGITTAFHALTWSWEPGLRGAEHAQRFAAALERMRSHLICDARLHLRWETFNLAAVAAIEDWLQAGRIDLLAFNDHTPQMIADARCETGLRRYVERTGLDAAALRRMLGEVWERRENVAAAITRLARAAQEYDVPCASHDDESPSIRSFYRGLGVRLSEFPTTRAAAEAAYEAGDVVLMGAPNIVRGGSHLSKVSAEALVRAGLCDVLTSDYFYPSPLHAVFRLVREGVDTLEHLWPFVSRNPAAAAGLDDRGVLASGKRADLVVVDASDIRFPRVIATIAGGRTAVSTSPRQTSHRIPWPSPDRHRSDRDAQQAGIEPAAKTKTAIDA
jgi:alpha-D-ribose 1-methylphosphonate 5-triphosphate diphosphatase